MTAVLAGLLVILIGGQLRARPRPRSIQSLPPALPGCDNGAARRPARRRFRLPQVLAVRRRLRHRNTAPTPEQVAAWCDGLARSISSGSTLAAAIHEVDPPPTCAAAIESMRLALRRGASIHAACVADSGSTDLNVAFTVIRACATHGGPPAQPLSRAAATLRGRAADAAERRTQSAQARMSALVMTVLPLGMMALLLLTSGSVRQFAASPGGIGVVAFGGLLNLLGWRWMSRLIDGGRR